MTPDLNLSSIAFDAKRAVLNYSGLGNYSRLVLELISQKFPKTELRLYTPKIKENSLLSPLLKNPEIKIYTPDSRSGKLFGSFWRSRGMTRQLMRERPQLYHGLSNLVPAGLDKTGIPSVVTIHDLIFIPHPEFYHRMDAEIYKHNFKRSALTADRIMAISECTKRDLIHYYNIPEEKIDVVYQGCDNPFYIPVSSEKMEEVKKRYNLPERYIIGIGTIEKRKNQLLTLKALQNLPSDVSLILVGRYTDYVKDIIKEANRLNLTKRLQIIHGADFKDFPALYAGAVFSSYPSRYEGFGIPVIESLAAGTPVVAATGSCLEEAGGPGGIYVDPDSVEEFTETAKVLLEDNTLRQRMIDQGRNYITRFSPDNFTKGLVESYSKTLHG